MIPRQSRATRAFTLIEMLTVMAITGVLLTLIIVPVVQSFNLTREAQGNADAQNKARQLIEKVTREIANSAGVRDNSGIRGMVAVPLPGRNGTAIDPILLELAKLDIIRPAEGDPTRGPSGAFINPDTGLEDPTLRGPKGQVILPVTPGDTLVRYFIGLRDPSRPYVNPYDALLTQRSGDRDNLTVLLRAEVRPYIWDRPNNRFVVNTRFFEVDPATVQPGDPLSGQPVLDDPYFWIPDRGRDGSVLTGAALTAKTERVNNWRAIAQVQTEISRYDAIQPVYTRNNRSVVYDGDVPRVLPLVQFRPTAIGSEIAAGQAYVRLSEESENMGALAPDVFRTRFGGWNELVVRLWPNGFSQTDPNLNQFTVGRSEQTVDGPRFSLYSYDPDSGVSELLGGTKVFDATTYDQAIVGGFTYPFSRALESANLGTAAARNTFAAFWPDARTGRLTASFGIDEVGDPAATPPATGNLPTAGTGEPFSVTNDPNTSGALQNAPYAPSVAGYQINRSFNKVWRERPELRPNLHRFIDLRVLRLPDGTPSPLHPDPLLGFARARLVPGSETVIGPDQNPGPNYGQPIRYTRTTGEPGPNEYRINYVDLPEPTDYTLIGVSPSDLAGFNPNSYNPANFVSAFIQPRSKAGYIQLHSDPNVPLPGDDPATTVVEGNIQVFYRFQFTGAGDSVGVDYDTRQIMSVLLTIRNFPQSNVPNPATVTVTGSATVRNVLR